MKKVLLLAVLFLGTAFGYTYKSGDTIVRVGESELKPISACVLPAAKDKYTRVCMAGKRYVITKDDIGGYYIEKAFSDERNPANRCSCRLVDKALDKYYYERSAPKRKAMAQKTLNQGQILIGKIEEPRVFPGAKTTVKRKARTHKLGLQPIQIEDDKPLTAVKLPKEANAAKPVGYDDGKTHFTCVKCQ